MSRGRVAGLVGVALASGVACRRAPSAADAGPSAAPSASVDADSFAPRVLTRPARCQPTPVGYALDDGRGMDDLEIGDAVSGPAGIAVDLVHRTSAGLVAAIALVAADGSNVKVRDLGPILGDAPPPRAAPRDGDWLALSYAPSKRDGARELSLFTLTPSGDVRAAGTIAEPRDDSLAFDLGRTLVVWDEVRPGADPRGVIRIAEVGADGHPGPAHDVSPPESDAEAPRLVPLAGGGALVFWLARKPEQGPPVDAAPAEITGEAPAFAWLEVATVDVHGAGIAGASARRLTSATGHVSNFDVTPLSPGALVVARDDGESVDGSGGALLRVRVRADGEDPPVAFATDGLGRGAPSFVDGAPPWLSWVAPREEGRLLALDGMGVPTQLPSVEPALDEGRPLAWLEPGKRLLVATPSDPEHSLRVLACNP